MRCVHPFATFLFATFLLATAAFAQSTVTLDATSGSNAISTNYTTTGGLTLNLGFFAEYLVLAGGGGGGGSGDSSSAWGGGGGGAGGLRTGTTTLSGSSYTVVVGGGGAGGQYSATAANQQGKNGANSVFGAITAAGGGGGGSFQVAGNAGGSGGGGGGRGTGTGLRTAGGAGNTPATTPSQGSNGGASRDDNSSGRSAGGGGGGAGAVGGTGGTNASTAGNGGDGLASSITGFSVTYAGGGGGGARDNFSSETAGTGGAGGGGAGSVSGTATAGTDGLGGGGGGVGTGGAGGQGGAGRVIVRYQGASLGNIGGNVTSGSGSAAGYTLHTFTTTGTASNTSALNLSGVNMSTRLGATLTGTLTGNGGMTFNGPGTLTLAAANTFSGFTRVLAGTLVVSHSSALQNSTLDIEPSDAGAVSFSQDSTLAGLTGTRNLDAGGITLSVGNGNVGTNYGGVLTNGALTKIGGGTFTLSGANTFSGPTRVVAGTLLVSNASALQNSTLDMNAADAGSVTFNQNSTLGGLTGSRTLPLGGKTLTVGNNDTSSTYGGTLGNGRLVKIGSGTFTVTGASVNLAATVVSGGVLAVGPGGSIANSGTTVVVGGNLAGDSTANGLNGSLVINGGKVTGRDVLIAHSTSSVRSSTGLVSVTSGTLSASGNLGVGMEQTGYGSYLLAGTGTLNVFGGSVVDVRGGLAYGDKCAINVSAGGAVKVGGDLYYYGSSGGIGNDGTVTFDGTEQRYWGPMTGTGAVVMAGSTLDVYGSLNSTGGVTISSGRLTAWTSGGDTGAIGSDVVNNGVLEFVTSNRTNRIFAGSISGSGRLAASHYKSSLTLTGNNTFTGLTSVISTGTLSVGDGGTSGSLTGDISLRGSALIFNRSDASTYAGNIVGKGSLTKLGTGALTLSGSSSFSGDTLVSSGTLILNSANALGPTAAVTVASGATLQANQPIRIGYIDSQGTVNGGENLSATLTVTRSGNIGGIANGSDSQGTFAAGVVKLGTGTSTVNAANAYTGLTWVREGTLALGAANAFAAASDLTVDSGATLDRAGYSTTVTNADLDGTVGNTGGGGLLTVTGTLSGSGSVDGPVLVTGVHTPGNSPGIQTFSGNLTYDNAALIYWELTDNTQSNSPVVYDQVVLTGAANLAFSGSNGLVLSFDGAGSLVDWNDSFWDVNRSWTVFDLASGVTTGFSNLSLGGSLLDRNGLVLDGATRGNFGLTQSGQDVLLTFTAVPEPSTLALVGVGAALAAWVARVRRAPRNVRLPSAR